MTDFNGTVVSTYKEGNGSWQNWFVARNSFYTIAKPGQLVTALWRDSNHLDLFITDKNGIVQSAYFEGNGPWTDWFVPKQSFYTIAVPGQPVTALWRPNSNHLDLFITGKDGNILSTYFDTNQWQQLWFLI